MKQAAFTILLTFLLFLVSANLVHGRQALRRDIERRERELERREKLADIYQRQAPTGGGSTCGGSDRSRKRSMAPGIHGLFLHPADFSGEVLSPSQIASIMITDGSFVHHNGSHSVDYKYQEEANMYRERQGARGWNPARGAFDWGKRALVSVSLRVAARGVVEYFQHPDKIFLFSEDYGLESRDVIRLIKALLADEDLDEVILLDTIITRPILETVLQSLCPRLGEEYCED